jgi:hypothetical protein
MPRLSTNPSANLEMEKMKKSIFCLMLVFFFCSCGINRKMQYVMHKDDKDAQSTLIQSFMANAVKYDSIKPFFSNSIIYIYVSRSFRPSGGEAIAFRGDSVFMVSNKIGFNEFIKGENCTIESDTSALHLVKIFISLQWYDPEGVIRFHKPPKIKRRRSWFEVRIDFMILRGGEAAALGRADYIVNRNGVIEGY